MAKDMNIGVWAFFGGIILAVLVGIATAFTDIEKILGAVFAIMALLGIIVGMLNIKNHEVNSFIIAAIGLTSGSVAIAGLGVLLPVTIGQIVETAFRVFGVFVAGAVFIPALKSIYRISRD